MTDYILAIDQGTTTSRAIIFDENAKRIAVAQEEFQQHFPADGWVEHEGEDIWLSTLRSCQQALKKAQLSADKIKAIGITNQRETTLIWNRETGKTIHRAIVWQDRRTADYCQQLRDQGHSQKVQKKTGLLLDPYFSASKIRWLLNEIPGAREAAARGELAFGTVDSFILWNLTGGKSHYTDATNASRTMLFDIHAQCWDEELLKLFSIPKSLLPEVLDCAADFGNTKADLLGSSIPISAMIGDQQAAAFGQCCFESGMAKSTYGTGCFLLLNTGSTAQKSRNQLLTTVAFRLNGKTSYALEGSIFMAGATIQWLRDGLKIISNAGEVEEFAKQTSEDSPVYLVPAFTGLGAPYWDADARGAIYGLTRDTGIKEIVTAALLSVCYQTRDLQIAMEGDGASISTLRVDGGMVINDFMLQKLADLLNAKVDRPEVTETTALGAAYMAGLQTGVYSSLQDIATHWHLDKSFTSSKDDEWRKKKYGGWIDAVGRTRSRG